MDIVKRFPLFSAVEEIMTVYHLGHLQNRKLIDADMYKKGMMLVPETRIASKDNVLVYICRQQKRLNKRRKTWGKYFRENIFNWNGL